MFRFAKRALMNALIMAAVATPLSGMAATVVVRDAPQTPCKLVSAPFAAHKTPYRSSHYVCSGVAYSVSDPRLTRTSSGAIVRQTAPGATRLLAEAEPDPERDVTSGGIVIV